MIEKQPQTAEEQTGPVYELTEACFDMQDAIRGHEKKALQYMRKSQQQKLTVADRSFRNTALSGQVYNLAKQPSIEIVRQNMRNGLRARADVYRPSNPDGTVFWQVLETEESAADRLPEGDVALQVDVIWPHGAGENRETLYNLQVQNGQLSVRDPNGEVEPDRFEQPLYIIQTCRTLYP
jgi:hypothetical protein